MGTIQSQQKQPLAQNAQLVPIAQTRPLFRVAPKASIVQLEPTCLKPVLLDTLAPLLLPLQRLAQMGNIETLQLSPALLVVQDSSAMIKLVQCL
jgi:hypothetical protein